MTSTFTFREQIDSCVCPQNCAAAQGVDRRARVLIHHARVACRGQDHELVALLSATAQIEAVSFELAANARDRETELHRVALALELALEELRLDHLTVADQLLSAQTIDARSLQRQTPRSLRFLIFVAHSCSTKNRPYFLTLEFDETIINPKSLVRAMVDAGALIGLGDYIFVQSASCPLCMRSGRMPLQRVCRVFIEMCVSFKFL
jgi:hypothetical protein